MKILFDCDGVLNNFQEHLLNILNKKHNTNYTIDDITYYDWIPDTFDFDTNLVGERNVIVGKDKSMIRGDLLVDDFPKNLDKFISGRTICFAQPWNKEYDKSIRTNDWDKIKTIIDNM